jgi:hypothetical protein
VTLEQAAQHRPPTDARLYATPIQLIGSQILEYKSVAIHTRIKYSAGISDTDQAPSCAEESPMLFALVDADVQDG